MDLQKWNIFTLLDNSFLQKLKTVCVFGNLGNEAILITMDDEVFAMGLNTSGCLGLGNVQSSLVPKKIEALSGKQIKGLSYGSGPHVVAYNSLGEVFTWGQNGYGELGNGLTNQSLVPTQVPQPLSGRVVIDVACGSHHTLALTEEGEVFAWGWNNCGQVGSGIGSNQNGPRKVSASLGGKKIVSICCGQTSSMAVVDNGEVYAWGYNGSGQLGVGNNTNHTNPARVVGLCNVVIVKVVCGYAHTLALSDQGELFAWGANTHGQLATDNKTSSYSPVHVAVDIGRVVDIAASHYCHTSAAKNQNGVVFMWGQCLSQSVCTPTPTPYSSLYEVFACCSTPNVTWCPITVRCPQVSSIMDSMKMAFDDQNTSDLTIMVQKKPIYVHRAILKIRCQHFRSMFQEHWSESNGNVIELDQFSYEVYKAFLQYLYTDQLDIAPEMALEMLDLGNSYCENNLKRRCEQIITQGITIENAAILYTTAITYQAQDLEEFCFKFSLNHMTAFVQSSGFRSLEEATVKKFILEAAKAGAFKT
uniref:BTB domain-containing protein n=1 Tax=Clastoptera arizonana TaxID=38151 RepID=A0A1B6BZZ7_9HEMI